MILDRSVRFKKEKGVKKVEKMWVNGNKGSLNINSSQDLHKNRITIHRIA